MVVTIVGYKLKNCIIRLRHKDLVVGGNKHQITAKITVEVLCSGGDKNKSAIIGAFVTYVLHVNKTWIER